MKHLAPYPVPHPTEGEYAVFDICVNLFELLNVCSRLQLILIFEPHQVKKDFQILSSNKRQLYYMYMV